MDEWWSKCLAGDAAAWETFVTRYAPVIYAAIGRLLRLRNLPGADALADDLCQEVFLRLLKEDRLLLRRYRPGRASLETYLTVVARSTALDALRRKHVNTVALESVPPPASAPQDLSGSPATDAIPEGLLTARQRLVLHLLFDREMDTPSVAAAMGISEQTVRSCRHKALQRLREHFSRQEES